MKKITIAGLPLLAVLVCGTGYADEPAPPVNTAEVQNSLESIVASCEKKKLPTEQEIECIEQGYLKYMGEDGDGGS